MSLSEGESGNRRGRQRLLYLILVGMGHINCRAKGTPPSVGCEACFHLLCLFVEATRGPRKLGRTR